MEEEKLFIKVTKIALVVLCILCIIVHLITFDFHYTIGSILGGLMSIGGFWWIVGSTNNMDQKPNFSKMIVAHYCIRYLIYAITMIIGVKVGLNIFSMLVGFLCINLAIKINAYQEGKEED